MFSKFNDLNFFNFYNFNLKIFKLYLQDQNVWTKPKNDKISLRFETKPKSMGQKVVVVILKFSTLI